MAPSTSDTGAAAETVAEAVAEADRLIAACRRVLDAASDGTEVVVWIVELAALPAGLRNAASAVLPGDELKTSARRPEPDAERFRRRRLVRRVLLAAHTGAHAGELRFGAVCHHCGDPAHGKPYLISDPSDGAAGGGGRATSNVEFNTASSDDAFVMAVSRRPVGVDAQRVSTIDGPTGDRLARFAHRSWPALEAVVPAPASTVRVWTAGEALSKGLGFGLWAAPGAVDGSVPDWTLRWVEPSTDVVACVATPQPASPMLVVRLTDVIAADHLATDVIAADHLATDVIAADHLATDVIAADHLATDVIAADHLATDLIATDVIATDRRHSPP